MNMPVKVPLRHVTEEEIARNANPRFTAFVRLHGMMIPNSNLFFSLWIDAMSAVLRKEKGIVTDNELDRNCANASLREEFDLWIIPASERFGCPQFDKEWQHIEQMS
jgi:hypothetical protein